MSAQTPTSFSSSFLWRHTFRKLSVSKSKCCCSICFRGLYLFRQKPRFLLWVTLSDFCPYLFYISEAYDAFRWRLNLEAACSFKQTQSSFHFFKTFVAATSQHEVTFGIFIAVSFASLCINLYSYLIGFEADRARTDRCSLDAAKLLAYNSKLFLLILF